MNGFYTVLAVAVVFVCWRLFLRPGVKGKVASWLGGGDGSGPSSGDDPRQR